MLRLLAGFWAWGCLVLCMEPSEEANVAVVIVALKKGTAVPCPYEEERDFTAGRLGRRGVAPCEKKKRRRDAGVTEMTDKL